MMTMAQAAARHGSCHTPSGVIPLVYKCWSPDFSGRKSGRRPGLCRAADGPGRSSNTANPNHLCKYSSQSLSRDAGKLDEEIGLDWLLLFRKELLCSGGTILEHAIIPRGTPCGATR